MKNLLTQWETEEENQKTGGNVPLIDRAFAKLEDNAKCASLPKLTELVKKPSNLTRTGKEKPGNALNFLASGDMLRKSWKINKCVGEKLLNLMRKLERKTVRFWKEIQVI